MKNAPEKHDQWTLVYEPRTRGIQKVTTKGQPWATGKVTKK